MWGAEGSSDFAPSAHFASPGRQVAAGAVNRVIVTPTATSLASLAGNFSLTTLCLHVLVSFMSAAAGNITLYRPRPKRINSGVSREGTAGWRQSRASGVP